MANYFHRQLGYYADAHRDRINSVMHMIGNPILFVAVVLPLSLLPVSVLGVEISAAPLLTIPALILWTGVGHPYRSGYRCYLHSPPFCRQRDCRSCQHSLGMAYSGWAICSWLGIADRWTSAVRGQTPNFARQSRSDADQPNVYLRQAFRRARLATGSCGRFAKIVPNETPLDRPHRPVGGQADVGKTS